MVWICQMPPSPNLSSKNVPITVGLTNRSGRHGALLARHLRKAKLRGRVLDLMPCQERGEKVTEKVEKNHLTRGLM